MDLTLGALLTELRDPALAAIVALTLGVVLVNGWTDAPNAIATCVATRAVGPRAAVLMAAVFNFLGVLTMTALNASVAATIYGIADFGGDARAALTALAAALFAIVVWASAAWWFGIPTSESHALTAGVTGAAVALHGGFSGVRWAAWSRVLWGLGLSTLLGFALGFALARLTRLLGRGLSRPSANRAFSRAQAAGGAAMAFMHGAQDGQKFMGIFLLGVCLARGGADAGSFAVPVWLMLLCSAVMALGTSIGGYRIIKSVGLDMVRLTPPEGFCADLAGACCLLLSSLGGLPVSTTHTKTSAVMGVGAARRLTGVRWDIAWNMALTWILTFPGCGALGYLFAVLFLRVF
ncbi:inorganic phosphate transporter [Feifania hominis]|uniref:Inorganic phosphate transporter n=1 Tax=Feifania hominis TaxID=2763660 RepID=A0A926DFI9_9FIRM|nr:inorganic phosphate transporter [Feifania hominis]MBC8536859.1 inorganic phosphate transporter [Feifania hominis]